MEQSEPYFDDIRATTIIGKRLLVGVTRCAADGTVLGSDQFHGIIVRASRVEGIILRVDLTGEERWTPPDMSPLEIAPPGAYTLAASGEVVDNPDLLTTWTVYPKALH